MNAYILHSSAHRRIPLSVIWQAFCNVAAHQHDTNFLQYSRHVLLWCDDVYLWQFKRTWATLLLNVRLSVCGLAATGHSAVLAMRPARHRPQGPCHQGAPNMKAGIQYSYSLPMHYDCCPTFIAIYQGSAESRLWLKFGLRDHAKPSTQGHEIILICIFIRQNKCDHLGLLFYVLSFIQFCARKLLLPIVCLALKLIFNYRVFSTKLYADQMFKSRKFRIIF